MRLPVVAPPQRQAGARENTVPDHLRRCRRSRVVEDDHWPVSGRGHRTPTRPVLPACTCTAAAIVRRPSQNRGDLLGVSGSDDRLTGSVETPGPVGFVALPHSPASVRT